MLEKTLFGGYPSLARCGRVKGRDDLHPIEQVFARLKHLMRKVQPGDVEATWRKAGRRLDVFSPSECATSLINSGYGSS